MTTKPTVQDPQATDFLALSPAGDRAQAPCLQTLRLSGHDHFSSSGLPTTRDEGWRFTSLRALKNTEFFLPKTTPESVNQAQLATTTFPDLGGTTLVFIDGLGAPHVSTRRDVAGLTVLPLPQAAAAGNPRLLHHLGKHATPAEGAFAALNAAMFRDGAFIHVARGTHVADPIVLLHVSTATDRPWMSHPRHVIVCDEQSQLTVIEHHVSLTDGACLTNVVTEIVAGEEASVCHYRIEEESAAAFHVATLCIHQSAKSSIESHCVLFGGSMVRNNVHPVLDGAGCTCLLNGLYVGNDQQHLDNHMQVDHVKPGCDSRQFYKGILDGKASAVFCGRIHVAPEAQKTDAKQNNASLLLSDNATNHSQPQLEIYADDVKCTHGATIGQIDEDAIFYLQARGIRPDAARAMMVFAHAAECLDRMGIEPLRDMLKQRLLHKMSWGTG